MRSSHRSLFLCHPEPVRLRSGQAPPKDPDLSRRRSPNHGSTATDDARPSFHPRVIQSRRGEESRPLPGNVKGSKLRSRGRPKSQEMRMTEPAHDRTDGRRQGRFESGGDAFNSLPYARPFATEGFTESRWQTIWEQAMSNRSLVRAGLLTIAWIFSLILVADSFNLAWAASCG